LATARSAFSLLHRTLKPRHVWLPSFLCGIILPAFNEPKTEINFYALDEHLQIADDNWLSIVQEGDVVVFIDYFGFRLWDSWGKVARDRGAWIVEDACQALLNERFSEHAHYIIFSPRKFVGVPDGGVLLANGDVDLPEYPLDQAPSEWWHDALTACVRRADFDHGTGDEQRSWFNIFQKVEQSGPMAPTAMSELSAYILKHCINWAEITRRREENYCCLAGALGEFALFPELIDGVVPIGFPVRFANRNDVRTALFSSQIFPPVHWCLRGIVPENFTSSHLLAGQILTIPCDQRYRPKSIDRLIKALRKVSPQKCQTV
jgi:dTDP-4-amino-4,6-dideoxygalactose transaminase